MSKIFIWVETEDYYNEGYAHVDFHLSDDGLPDEISPQSWLDIEYEIESHEMIEEDGSPANITEDILKQGVDRWLDNGGATRLINDCELEKALARAGID